MIINKVEVTKLLICGQCGEMRGEIVVAGTPYPQRCCCSEPCVWRDRYSSRETLHHERYVHAQQ